MWLLAFLSCLKDLVKLSAYNIMTKVTFAGRFNFNWMHLLCKFQTNMKISGQWMRIPTQQVVEGITESVKREHICNLIVERMMNITTNTFWDNLITHCSCILRAMSDSTLILHSRIWSHPWLGFAYLVTERLFFIPLQWSTANSVRIPMACTK